MAMMAGTNQGEKMLPIYLQHNTPIEKQVNVKGVR